MCALDVPYFTFKMHNNQPTSFNSLCQKQAYNSHIFLDYTYIYMTCCDTIKTNESDVGKTEFKLPAKILDKFLCFMYIVFELKLFKSLQPDVRLSKGLNENVAF